ncbi:MAG TPA: WecB/TagA/CpsF family glycosyltransferase [Candidatus Acidoferrales bacterium]|nr:WecB/TagA/CpsF family glycosyltransferase [Candidatus Acidoferrales bacterium]
MTVNESTGPAPGFDGGAVGNPAIHCLTDTGLSNSSAAPSPRLAGPRDGNFPTIRYAKVQEFRKSNAPRPASQQGFPSERPLPSFQVLGNRVHAIQMSDAVERMCCWIDEAQSKTRYVAVTGMHGIAESMQNSEFRQILNTAGLVVPDGMPLVWLGRLHGFPLRQRVCGPELMESFCQRTGSTYRHFFFGGTDGVAEKLAKTLRGKYGIVVAGTYTPPFRALNDEEEKELNAIVKDTAPDILWVGLSTPKHEKWMYEHRHRLKVAVMLGVGAAFDMNSGGKRRAPEWMRSNGLEWLFRLISEPRRLWKRYLITIPRAVWFVCLELLRFPKLPSAAR